MKSKRATQEMLHTWDHRRPQGIHSFRHSFTDALRLAAVPGEINVALVGHTDPNVNDKVRREGQGDTLSPQARRSGCERGLCRTGPGAFDEPAGHTRHQGAHTPRRR
jgi:hypothetical protein